MVRSDLPLKAHWMLFYKLEYLFIISKRPINIISQTIGFDINNESEQKWISFSTLPYSCSHLHYSNFWETVSQTQVVLMGLLFWCYDSLCVHVMQDKTLITTERW